MAAFALPLIGAAGSIISSLLGPSGPSPQQQQQAAQMSAFSQTLQGYAAQRFGTQSQLFSSINNAVAPIVSAGINQGVSPEVVQAQTAQAIANAGAATRNAEQYAANQPAGQSSTGIQSGIQDAIRGGIAATEGANLSNTLNENTLKNAETGRQNYEFGVSAQNALAGLENPGEYVTGANTAGQEAFNALNINNTESNNSAASKFGAVTGAISNVLPSLFPSTARTTQQGNLTVPNSLISQSNPGGSDIIPPTYNSPNYGLPNIPSLPTPTAYDVLSGKTFGGRLAAGI